MSDEKFTDLETISPLDGRYRGRVEELLPYFSQKALDGERVRVEIEYLVKLGSLEEIPIDPPEKSLREIHEEFDLDDARTIARIETEGYRDIPPTNHDVKAVEYYVREELKDRNLAELIPFVHFGLTSEDVNNLAYASLIKGATGQLIDRLVEVSESLITLAENNANMPMLARTHGQPATPTTMGKEFAVFLSRLVERLENLEEAREKLTGKLSGATGNLNAHSDSYSNTDWLDFAREFVREYGLKPNQTVTQIEPRDNMANLFQAISRINNVLVDLSRDCWTYISQSYFSQKQKDSEVGSSTMPQKVNPIDFENGEGNLSKANSDLEFLADYLTTSRTQRDLSDSTVRRNVGVAFAHALIGYKSVQKGLGKVEPNREALRNDLADHPEVLAEAWQTSLRKYGHSDAYEVVKELTRGEKLDAEMVGEVIDELPLPTNERARLKNLTPETYLGKAKEITLSTVEQAKETLSSFRP
ncbi:adenylosuccinate lyase [Candidatus Bipolaricaulota bacterium]|nr:adenylosuccinate lyase [Candidatus Bipolaricaulota bacterium]MBS3792792.1 adenylosuccinate lyase [Candidatus Bipolaricaulota bacterium]